MWYTAFIMNWSEAIILGLVQGVTEFLPVSSSGHLVLARAVLQTEVVYGLAFDAILHFATALAVIVYFWEDIYILIQTLLRKLGRLPVNRDDEILLYTLMIATLPGAVLGFFLESHISSFFHSPVLVASALIVLALFFMVVEYYQYSRPTVKKITSKSALIIGLSQVLALLPGVSRSGITIGTGMLLGLSRYTATRFSFLMAVPITLGVGTKLTLDTISANEIIAWGPVILASTVSFTSALLVIHYFLRFVRKYTLWPFIWYILILAMFIMLAHFFT